MRHAIYILALVVSAGFFSGCQEKTSSGKGPGGDSTQVKIPPRESSTSGRIKVACDESLQPIGRQLFDAFMANFPKAELIPYYLPESQLFRYLMEDSVRFIISTRKLEFEEQQRLNRIKIYPDYFPLATGGVAVLVNQSNPIQQLRDDQLRLVLTGQIQQWNQIDPKGSDKEIQVVFDHAGSSVVRSIKNQYLNNAELSPRSFAGKNSLDVVDYVSKAPGAIGLVGYEWIADKDDDAVHALLDSVAVMALEAPDSADLPGEFFKPYPNEFALKRYPLSRSIMVISREPFTGLGTGFAIFATSDQGQRLLLKAGMVPEHMPTRLIKLPPKE